MSSFRFKYFTVQQKYNALKVGTDAMLLGSFIDPSGKTKALDVGTGTGVLSLMVAQKNRTLSIDAIEIDPVNCLDCSENFKNSPWSDHLKLINADFFTFSFKEKYDLIFSNPPFYSDSLLSNSQRVSKAKHTAFFSIELFFKRVTDLLTENGEIYLIIPYVSAKEWETYALNNHLTITKKVTLFSKKESNPIRQIIVFSKKKNDHLTLQSFFVRNHDGSYSDEYKILTKDFHGVVLR